MPEKKQEVLVKNVVVTPELFRQELKNCFLLSDEDKAYWLTNADSLPLPVLESLFINIRDKNSMMQSYLIAVLDNDKENKLVDDLKLMVKNFKKSALKIEESDQRSDTDVTLDQDLANL